MFASAADFEINKSGKFAIACPNRASRAPVPGVNRKEQRSIEVGQRNVKSAGTGQQVEGEVS